MTELQFFHNKEVNISRSVLYYENISCCKFTLKSEQKKSILQVLKYNLFLSDSGTRVFRNGTTHRTLSLSRTLSVYFRWKACAVHIVIFCEHCLVKQQSFLKINFDFLVTFSSDELRSMGYRPRDTRHGPLLSNLVHQSLPVSLN